LIIIDNYYKKFNFSNNYFPNTNNNFKLFRISCECGSVGIIFTRRAKMPPHLLPTTAIPRKPDFKSIIKEPSKFCKRKYFLRDKIIQHMEGDMMYKSLSMENIMDNVKSTDQIAGDLPSGIGSPARSALAAGGITHLEQLTRISAAELLKLHGVGPKAIRILNEELSKQGLKFSSPDESRHISEATNHLIERRAQK
jgi:hypothetical protein